MSKNIKKQQQSLKIPKLILNTAKFLELISPKLATQFAAKLFTTPIKHKIPNRELEMDAKSKQSKLLIPSINKEIVVYQYGNSNKKILLVHGWSGRGTQLYKVADALLQNGFSTISFDAPAHGKSKGNSTIMVEFIASILEIEKQFGPFEFAVGHSLGGMSLLNSLNKGLKINKLVIIGSGNLISDIIKDFIRKLNMNPKQEDLLRFNFEKKYKEKMNNLSSYLNAEKISIPVLVIHDQNDDEVPVRCAHEIIAKLKNHKLMITNNLGHRKILGDENVINEVVCFFN